MIKKVAYTMLPVRNTRRARAFYEEILRLKVGSHSDSGVWTEYDLPGGGCLALFANPETANRDDADAPPSGPTGGATIAFEVEDLEVISHRLKGLGVKFVTEGVESPVCRMSIITDTEGNAIILHQLNANRG